MLDTIPEEATAHLAVATAPPPLPYAAPQPPRATAYRAHLDVIDDSAAPSPTPMTAPPAPPGPPSDAVAMPAQPQGSLQPLSDSLRQQLLERLPPARTPSDVRDSIDAAARRVARRIVPTTKRTQGAQRYSVVHRPLNQSRGRTSGTDYDLRRCAQATPTRVVEVLADTADQAGISRDLLAQAVLGALGKQPRSIPPQPEPGACVVPSPIDADYVRGIAAAAGVPHIDALDRGIDLMYHGGRRWDQVDNHPGAHTDTGAAFLRGKIDDGLARGWLIDVTELLRTAPLIPHSFLALTTVPKKKDEPDGPLRMICDGSSGDGINVQSDPSRLRPALLSTPADAAAAIWRLKEAAQGAPLAGRAFDAAHAYSNLGVRVEDWFLQCIAIDDRTLLSTRAVFGTVSAGFYCAAVNTAVADATVSDAKDEGISACAPCFSDDTMLVVAAEADSWQARRAEELQRRNMQRAGMPPADKCDRPWASTLLWTGLDWDLDNMAARLPTRKRDKAIALAELVADSRRMTRHDLQSALGILEHAASVVPPLGAFLREAHALAHTAGPPSYYVSLTDSVREEAALWAPLLRAHNGTHLWPRLSRIESAPLALSDACTDYGIGFLVPSAKLYLSEPVLVATNPHINPLELLSAFLAFACAVLYPGVIDDARAVHIHTDSMAALGAITRSRSQAVSMSPIVRALALFSARHDVLAHASHVPGATHMQADDLSRGRLPPELLASGWRRVRLHPLLLGALLSPTASLPPEAEWFRYERPNA